MDRSIGQLVTSLRHHCANQFDFYVLADNTTGDLARYEKERDWFLFSKEELATLDYPKKVGSVFAKDGSQTAHHAHFNFPPGFTDLPLLHFFRHHPDYAYYWVVEYDVRFSGDWGEFFEELNQSDADLLCTTLTRAIDLPDWFHWSTLDVDLARDRYVRGFFPIYRMSKAGFAFLDNAYRQGAAGHYEGVIPSLFLSNGFKVEDIGGEGEFVPDHRRGRFYTNNRLTHYLNPGSFVFRPVRFNVGQQSNLLWHPVKQPSWYDWLKWRTGNILRKLKRVAGRQRKQKP